VKSDQDDFLNIPWRKLLENLDDFGFSSSSTQMFHEYIEQAPATGEVFCFERSFTVPQASDYEFRLVALGQDEVLAIAAISPNGSEQRRCWSGMRSSRPAARR
jgi:hypothetical protein